MSLVDYESSSSDSEDTDIPKLPQSFYENYVTQPRIGDDPDLHQGRHRILPHTIGSYPSHIYIEWIPTKRQIDQLNSCWSHVSSHLTKYEVHSLIQSPLGAVLPLHISLSDTIMVPDKTRDEFVQDVSRTVAMGTTGPKDKAVHLTRQLTSLYNADQSRRFIALKVIDGPENTLSQIRESINCEELTEKYRFPSLGSTMHVSIGWMDAKIQIDLDKLIKEVEKSINWELMNIGIDKVCIRIGRETRHVNMG